MEETTIHAAEQVAEATTQMIEVVTTVNLDPDLYLCLGFIASLIVLVMLSLFYNR